MSQIEKKDPFADKQKMEVVYIGRRYDERSKKTSYLFIRTEDLDPLNDIEVDSNRIDHKALWFSPKKKPEAYIGSKYTLFFEPKEDGKVSYWPNDLRYIPGQTKYIHQSVWQELDKIITHVKNTEMMQKKNRDDNRAQNAIDHLKWVYRQLPPGHRKAYLISLMLEIQK